MVWMRVERLRAAARQIAANRGEPPASGWRALAKIFIQPKRDWKRPGAPRVGWKRGEIFEVLSARSAAARAEEIGDCAYYIAQSALWPVLSLLPLAILDGAVRKFARRAKANS